MELLRKNILIKLRNKNRGNRLLGEAIDELIKTIEAKEWKSKEEIKADRNDADQIHNDGFYFFDIQVHRTMIMIQIGDPPEATVAWAGTHQEYDRIFKGNKTVIHKWLSDNEWI